MSFYTWFDWFKKLRLFVYVLNLKIDVVLKASRAVVIRWFSLNEAPLGLFKFISDLPYFEKINIFSNIIAKKVELIYTKIEINP
jgi:intein-encoded DNA endonuclease-like protein